MKPKKRKAKQKAKAKTKSKSKSNKSKAKKSKPRGMSRLEASVAAIRGVENKLAVHTVIQNADTIYVKSGGGKSNPAEAKWAFGQASKVMSILGLIDIKDGTLYRLK